MLKFMQQGQISIGGVQDQDTLIEQSTNPNRIKLVLLWKFSTAPKHTMKCIGLFKGLHSSTCVVNMYGNT